VIEPGGTAGGLLLLHLFDHWALMAGEDRLVPLTF
jgi:hypothetical protein